MLIEKHPDRIHPQIVQPAGASLKGKVVESQTSHDANDDRGRSETDQIRGAAFWHGTCMLTSLYVETRVSYLFHIEILVIC